MCSKPRLEMFSVQGLPDENARHCLLASDLLQINIVPINSLTVGVMCSNVAPTVREEFNFCYTLNLN
jgi:hypothetical protein